MLVIWNNSGKILQPNRANLFILHAFLLAPLLPLPQLGVGKNMRSMKRGDKHGNNITDHLDTFARRGVTDMAV
jgi:hypothetical protein